MERQTKGKPPEDLWRLDQVFCQLLCSLELIYLNVSSSSNLEYTLSCPEILFQSRVTQLQCAQFLLSPEGGSTSTDRCLVRTLGAVESLREKIGNRR